MIFKRKAYDQLKQWKKMSGGETAVLVEGARRVGKSTVVEEFAKNEYDDYLLIDFSIEDENVKNLFVELIGNPDAFFRNLFLLKDKELKPGDAIIFDEVQFFPEARQAIKHLVKDGRYHYIETGSLIGIKKNVQNILIPSEEERIKMYPMDFEEFLWACGNTVTIPVIREAYEQRKPLGDAIHRKVMRHLRTYMAVGGMPQAVDAFVKGETYSRIDHVKRNIIRLYEEDLRKYDEETNGRAAAVWNSLPYQLFNHGSHFKYASVEKGSRFDNYEKTMKWIRDSMIATFCRNVTMPEIALEMYAEPANFKLYMGDTGLLVSQILANSSETEENIYKSLIFDRIGINQGMIVENLVAQMLTAGGNGLFFHEYRYQAKGSGKESKYEIDFLLVRNRKICPVEVKSSGYQSHKSFDYFTEKYPIGVQDKFILYTKDLKFEDGILYLPIYMTMLL